MSKIAINNEIVLMRQVVRKVRVVIVHKLIKEAKLLQARKHGNEKILDKCKRKAHRLIAEITAIKKIKEDEISKFGITNTRKLQEVLGDTTCEPDTRVMTRLVSHKILADRIAKFKEKFPEYEQHLGPGRKKLSKLQRQANREARNAMKRNPGINGSTDKPISNETEDLRNGIIDENITKNSAESSNEEYEDNENSNEEIDNIDCNSKIDIDVEESESVDSHVEQVEAENKIVKADDEKADEFEESITTKYNLKPGSILRIKTPSSTAKKRKKDDQMDVQSKDSTSKPLKNNEDSKISKKIKSIKAENKEATKQSVPVKVSSEPKKPKPVKVISKEASVKRFTELLEETETEEIVQDSNLTSSKKRDVIIEKEVDSFFMTENGDREYLSVVVPKSKLCDDDEQDDRFSQNHAAKRQQNFHERNNKFFSKIDQRSSNNSRTDKYGSNGGRQRSNDFSTGRGPPEKLGRYGNGPARNARHEFEKKIEAKEEVLHPSWAARKKQQEILKQGFQGKKIVFDD